MSLETIDTAGVSDSQHLAAVLDILKSLSARREASEVLFTFVSRIAEALEIDRCSVVRIDLDRSDACVLASHEDPYLRDLAIDLAKYPELRECVSTRRTVQISDTLTDPRTAPFAGDFEQSGITSVVVVPVLLFQARVGSMVLRAARKGRSFTESEVRFCELVAESASNALERAYLLEDLRRANADLQRMARTDGLTGLYNRAYFRQRLDEEISRAARYRQNLACVFVDVDNFKRINDTFGHLAGDGVLQEMARLALDSTRRHDIVARYGGEEIVILLPHTDRDGAIQQGSRLLEQVSTRSFASLGPDIRVTVSMGLSLFDMAAMATADDLLRDADAALYKAKELGKNRLVIGDDVYEN
jgi:two-component system cell cycle response regulator